jgi:hypothetical protein
MAPASEPHAVLQRRIGRRIGNHLIDQGHCRLLSQPGIVPKVRANRDVRVPGLGVTCVPPALGLTVADPIVLTARISRTLGIVV